MSDVDEAASDGERRALERAPVSLKVNYKRLNTFFADYTKNISKGGTFIRTKDPLELGSRFRFVLTAPEPDGSGATVRVELDGEVQWVVPSEDADDDHPAGMGVRFVFRDDAERRAVDELVTRLMRSSLGEHLAERLLAPGRR